MFDKIHAARLTKLADHLENGKLGHDEFDFGHWHISREDGRSCGSAGCAIGECPFVFQKEWKMVGGIGKPVLSDFPDSYAREADVFFAGMKFFGVSKREFDHLFLPGDQEPNHYGGEMLSYKATRLQVAAGIRAFLEYKGREEKGEAS